MFEAIHKHMPIEIKQLLIKSNIVQRVTQNTQAREEDLSALKEELAAECRSLIQDMLREREER